MSRHARPSIGTERPVIYDYQKIPTYVRAMVEWRKAQVDGFSIQQETKTLYKCSPALVTRIMQGKRRLTLDRVDALAALLKLSNPERRFLEEWVKQEGGEDRKSSPPVVSHAKKSRTRREGQNHLFANWLNIYVKDAARLKGFEADPKVIHRLLGGMSSPSQIQRSLDFLLAQGFLRRTQDGNVVEDDVLVTATDEIPVEKIRAFHKKALAIALEGIDVFPVERRQASTIVLPLSKDSFDELKSILKGFYEQVLQFAEANSEDNESLYQVVINLMPVGGQGCQK